MGMAAAAGAGPAEQALVPPRGARTQSELRQVALRLLRDDSLSDEERALHMQNLLSEEWQEIQRERQPPRLVLSEIAQRAKSYHATGTLGCKHYRRGCKLRAVCCGRLYPCRLCHDELEDHSIDRFATKEMLCMHCDTLQPVGQTCTNTSCGKQMARYYCAVCKFWDDDPDKHIYHCPYCKMCRIGRGLDIDFFHCHECGACMTMARRDSHTCVGRALDTVCPICQCGSLFTSTEPVVFATCGHGMHDVCFRKHLASDYRCPVCAQTAFNARGLWAEMDTRAAPVQVPPELACMALRVFCNDCARPADVPFRFEHRKCPQCGGYNTRVL